MVTRKNMAEHIGALRGRRLRYCLCRLQQDNSSARPQHPRGTSPLTRKPKSSSQALRPFQWQRNLRLHQMYPSPVSNICDSQFQRQHPQRSLKRISPGSALYQVTQDSILSKVEVPGRAYLEALRTSLARHLGVVVTYLPLFLPLLL